MRQPSKAILVKPSILPLLRDNTAVNGTGVDCIGYRQALVIAHLGATDIACTLSLEDSPDNSAWTAVASTDQATTATDDNESFTWDVDLSKRARYLRVIAPAADGTAGTTFGATILLMGGRTKNPSQQNTAVAV